MKVAVQGGPRRSKGIPGAGGAAGGLRCLEQVIAYVCREVSSLGQDYVRNVIKPSESGHGILGLAVSRRPGPRRPGKGPLGRVARVKI